MDDPGLNTVGDRENVFHPPTSFTPPNCLTRSAATKFATTDPQGQFCLENCNTLSGNSCIVQVFHQKFSHLLWENKIRQQLSQSQEDELKCDFGWLH